jgi:MFS family permease
VPTLHLLGWATGAVFFFYAWILRVAPSVMIEEMMRDLHVGGAVIGNLSALYFFGYAGMQIPVGVLIDRFGPRRLMTGAALICAAGCVLFAMSSGISGVAAGRFLIGASAAFSLVGAMAVAGLWFPAQRFALLSGLAMMLGMAGGVFGQAPLRLAVEVLDWRGAILALAGGGVLLAVLIWGAVRDRPHQSRSASQMLGGLGSVLRNKQTWLIAIAGLGTTGPLLGFAGLWGVPYFVATLSIDRAAAASITSMMFVGWGIGAPLVGWYSDRVRRRRSPFIFGLILCTVSMASILYLPGLGIPALMALCFACGFGGSTQITGFAAARENNPAGVSATAIGLVNGIVTGAGALFQPLLGWLLDLNWNGQMVAGARVYDAEAYRIALSVIIVGTVIGFFCTLALRETYCRPLEESEDASLKPSAARP